MILESKRVVEADEFKLILLAIKAPHDGAILPVYLEKKVKVSAGNQIIIVIILLHGIEVAVKFVNLTSLQCREAKSQRTSNLRPFDCKAITSFAEAASFIVAFGKASIIKGRHSKSTSPV